MAGKGKIINVVLAAVLLPHNVLDVVGKRAVLLLQQAVFAPAARSAPDKVTGGGIHR